MIDLMQRRDAFRNDVSTALDFVLTVSGWPRRLARAVRKIIDIKDS